MMKPTTAETTRAHSLRIQAAEVVYLVYRYSEVTGGAMIAPEIVDKLLALPAAVTRATEMIGS
jgi:hypothetical protein